jgi:hypothetical protein
MMYKILGATKLFDGFNSRNSFCTILHLLSVTWHFKLGINVSRMETNNRQLSMFTSSFYNKYLFIILSFYLVDSSLATKSVYFTENCLPNILCFQEALSLSLYLLISLRSKASLTLIVFSFKLKKKI